MRSPFTDESNTWTASVIYTLSIIRSHRARAVTRNPCGPRHFVIRNYSPERKSRFEQRKKNDIISTIIPPTPHPVGPRIDTRPMDDDDRRLKTERTRTVFSFLNRDASHTIVCYQIGKKKKKWSGTIFLGYLIVYFKGTTLSIIPSKKRFRAKLRGSISVK